MMIVLHLLCCYLINEAFAIQSRPEDDFYYAAVVEYNPKTGEDGNDTLFKNADEYVRIIKVAATSADIVIFPELGLSNEDKTVFVEIPFGNETVSPVDNPRLHPVLSQLSKAAKDNQVYVSFTIHEKCNSSSGEVLKYNTNVVFDRKGVIVARYRKYNLFNEYHLNITKVPEAVFFDSDFGVRFGMFICFDIYFKEPALTLVNEKHITDIIFPSWWFSELPSLLSVQMHLSWAYMTDTNLLAAGINSIQKSSTGSGIYAGKKGPLVYLFSHQDETQILSAKVYKKGKSGGMQLSKSELYKKRDGDSDLLLWNEDFSSYDTHLLKSTPVLNNSDSDNKFDNDLVLTLIENKTMCQGILCCYFMLNMTFTYRPEIYLNMSDESYIRNDSFYHYQYRLAILDGVRGFYGAKSAGLQVCSIIPCLNDSLSSCGRKSGNTLPLIIEAYQRGKMYLYSTSFNSISIKSISKNLTDFTFPDVFESSHSSDPKAFGSIPDVSKIMFNTDHLTSNLQFSSDRLVYAGLYSRIVSRDRDENNSSVTIKPFTYLPMLVALFVIFLIRKVYSMV